MNDISEMRRNRSPEEFAMRRTLMEWGRHRWPDARIVHELVVSERRIDMAFISRTSITGIEIKSSSDNLSRLRPQLETFIRVMPQVIVAVSPKWRLEIDDYICKTVICGDTIEALYFRDEPNRKITVQLLDLLWADEARAIAARMRINSNPKEPLYKILPMLARSLTGDEIVKEVCRELRARDAFPKAADHPESDPPIFDERPDAARRKVGA